MKGRRRYRGEISSKIRERVFKEGKAENGKSICRRHSLNPE